MADMRWNPVKYDEFSSERSAPFFDLVSRVSATAPRRVVDLGCGPGTLTATLAERWPDAEVVGYDSSADMLERAAQLVVTHPNLSFESLGIADWHPSEVDDVVVTNAALQWVPEHRALLPGWLRALPAGGWFAMQVPGSRTQASHRILRELALTDRWRARLEPMLRDGESVGETADYLETMQEAGMRVQAWQTEYLHVLQGSDPVLDWVRGTRLRPFLAALPLDEGAEFERAYGELLRAAYPAGPHGTVFPFRRMFAVGQRPADEALARPDSAS